MIWIHRLLAQLGNADFHRLTTLAFSCRISFRKMLNFIRRPWRSQTGLDEIVRHGQAIELRTAPDFFGFREQAIPDRDVSIDLVDDVFGMTEIGGFRRFRRRLLVIDLWENLGRAKWLSEPHNQEKSSSYADSVICIRRPRTAKYSTQAQCWGPRRHCPSMASFTALKKFGLS